MLSLRARSRLFYSSTGGTVTHPRRQGRTCPPPPIVSRLPGRAVDEHGRSPIGGGCSPPAVGMSKEAELDQTMKIVVKARLWYASTSEKSISRRRGNTAAPIRGWLSAYVKRRSCGTANRDAVPEGLQRGLPASQRGRGRLCLPTPPSATLWN